MKTIRLFTVMAVVFFMAFAQEAKAHRGHNGSHRHGVYTPNWVPDYMVRANTRHVYFPDFELYYDRWDGTFIFLNRGRWITSTYPPVALRNVNFARAYKVGCSINTAQPYLYHARNRVNHSRYYRHPRYRRPYQKRYSYGNQRNQYRHQDSYYEDDYRGEGHEYRNNTRQKTRRK